jgi:hypothetical protein
VQWVIENFSTFLPQQTEKLHSEEFIVGDFPWSASWLCWSGMHACMAALRVPIPSNVVCRDILLFPRGNKEVRGTGLSLYLNVSDAELAPPGWMRKATFQLKVVNQANPEQSVWKGAHSRLLTEKAGSGCWAAERVGRSTHACWQNAGVLHLRRLRRQRACGLPRPAVHLAGIRAG